MARLAVVIGGTGLIGGDLVTLLRGRPEYDRVRLLARTPPGHQDDKLTVERLDFGRMAARPELFAGDDFYCALGTTLRQAGSRAAFRRVDVDYVAEALDLAKTQGVKRVALVSAVGADAGAGNYYIKAKGDVEARAAGLGFDACHMLRPSLLTGKRAEFRFAERLGLYVAGFANRLLHGRFTKYRAIPAATVAGAAVAAVLFGSNRIQVHHYDEMIELNRRLGAARGESK